jgi:hypothetical protein
MAVSDTLAEISSEAELRELLGTPAPRVITKTIQPRKETLEELERYYGYGPQYETHLYG